MRFAPMTRAWAREILAWRHAGFYAVYNLGEDSLPELLEGRYAAALGEDGELRGFCCWGAAAQVPAAARLLSGRFWPLPGVKPPAGLCGLRLRGERFLCHTEGRGFPPNDRRAAQNRILRVMRKESHGTASQTCL